MRGRGVFNYLLGVRGPRRHAPVGVGQGFGGRGRGLVGLEGMVDARTRGGMGVREIDGGGFSGGSERGGSGCNKWSRMHWGDVGLGGLVGWRGRLHVSGLLLRVRVAWSGAWG